MSTPNKILVLFIGGPLDGKRKYVHEGNRYVHEAHDVRYEYRLEIPAHLPRSHTTMGVMRPISCRPAPGFRRV